MGPEDINTQHDDQPKELPAPKPSPAPTQKDISLSLLSLRRNSLEGTLTREANLIAEGKIGGSNGRLLRGPEGMKVVFIQKDRSQWRGDVSPLGNVIEKVRIGGGERDFSSTGFFHNGKNSYSVFGTFDGVVSIEQRALKKGDNTKGKASFEMKETATTFAMDPACRHLLAGFWGGKVYLARYSEGEKAWKAKQIIEPQGEAKDFVKVASADFSADGDIIAFSIGRKLFGIETQKAVMPGATPIAFEWQAPTLIESVSFNPWENQVAVSHGSSISLLRLEQRGNRWHVSAVASFEVGSHVTSVCFDHDGSALWYASSNGKLGKLGQKEAPSIESLDKAA